MRMNLIISKPGFGLFSLFFFFSFHFSSFPSLPSAPPHLFFSFSVYVEEKAYYEVTRHHAGDSLVSCTSSVDSFSWTELWAIWSVLSRQYLVPWNVTLLFIGFLDQAGCYTDMGKILLSIFLFHSLIGWSSDLSPRDNNSGKEENESWVLILLLPVILIIII